MEERPFKTKLLFFLLSCCGLLALPYLTFQLNPGNDVPVLSVEYAWTGVTPDVLEREATAILEAAFATLEGLSSMGSETGSGKARITLKFDSGTNIDKARIETLALVRQVFPSLPAGVSYPVVAFGDSGENTVNLLSYIINAKGGSTIEIGRFIETIVTPQLNQIKGIREIIPQGIAQQYVAINVDPNLLERFQISFETIIPILEQYFTPKELGLVPIESFAEEGAYYLPLSAHFKNIAKEELLAIPIKNWDARIIYLGDFAEVRVLERFPGSYTRNNGLNSAGFSITARDKSNQILIAKKVTEALANLATRLPEGWEMIKTYDASLYLERELKKLGIRTFLSTFLLLVFVLLLFQRIRYCWLVFLPLLSSLLIAVLFFYLFKIELHLFSLAGATFSIGILIDNAIVMLEHWRIHKDRKVFLAILGATLTTVCALGILLCLEEQLKTFLEDFVLVIAISLGVSLIVALFLIPALETAPVIQTLEPSFRKKRRIVALNRFYLNFLHRLLQLRGGLAIVVMLSFGSPIFLLPDTIDGDTWYKKIYNKSIGSEQYQIKIKPYIDVILGGSMRLFLTNVLLEPFDVKKERIVINVNIMMPTGSKIEHLDAICKYLEDYLSQFRGIERFETTVFNKNRASIKIFPFNPLEKTDYPISLQEILQTEVLKIGSAAFSVFGAGNLGFGNRTDINHLDAGIKLLGYNKLRLENIATAIKEKLDGEKKVIDSRIVSEDNLFIQNRKEFVLRPNNLSSNYLTWEQIYNELLMRSNKGGDQSIIRIDNRPERIDLGVSEAHRLTNLLLERQALNIDSFQYSLGQLLSIEELDVPRKILKKDQQYQLIVQYSAKGSVRAKKAFQQQQLDAINQELPIGFIAKDANDTLGLSYFRDKIWILSAAVLSVFLISATLLNSFRQAVMVVLFIPISYIGIFLTFYLFPFKFDLGGLISFLLITGITVNTVLYLLNEINILSAGAGRLSYDPIYRFVKALNHKVVPVLLTILSTILGFLPFVISTNQELFWFSLGVGTIGGLVFSIFALFIVFPVFFLKKNDWKRYGKILD